MPTPFRLYNTRTRSVDDFVPVTPGEIKLYVCGLTVYDHAHVGHARVYVVMDGFVRYLRNQGWRVNYVRNFTDVDDKIIRRANAQGVDAMKIANTYIDSFHADCERLELDPPTAEPRVSTSIHSIQAMIQALVDQGHAYEAGGSVWFSVSSFSDYGRLSGQDPTEMRSSPERSDDKRDPKDFCLWKASKPGEPSWESPWGPGRPGWHIECSAMAKEHLGDTIDIHGGGLDLVFPHHENECAQSICANQADYARYWMHNGLLTLVKEGTDGAQQSAKMGKSLGNTFGIREAVEAFPAEGLKLYYLQAHYRSPLPWSLDALPKALAMLARLYEAREVASSMTGGGEAEHVAKAMGGHALDVYEQALAFPERFHAALRDDFNTSEALGHAFSLARAINRMSTMKKAKLRAGPIAQLALQALDELQVLGLLRMSFDDFQEQVKQKRLGSMGISREHVEQLIADRAAARAAKDWAKADALRNELDAANIVVMDTSEGVKWRVQLGDPTS